MPEKFDFSKIEDQNEFENLPQEEKDEIVGEAQEEAEVENLEKELSPEIMEKIMDKVQDIKADGIAYSIVDTSKFQKIIDEGLLGSYSPSHDIQSQEISKEKWVQETRAKRNSFVYFNITGRGFNAESSHFEFGPIAESSAVDLVVGKTEKKNPFSDYLIFLFDISKFHEDLPIKDRFIEERFPQKTFRAIDKFSEKKDGELIVDEDFGFALTHRVAPRLFRGIVALFLSKPKEQEDWRSIIGAGPEFLSRANKYINTVRETYKDRKNLLLPIYDIAGNLAWPKQMGYEEVKKFVAERDKKKKEENPPHPSFTKEGE